MDALQEQEEDERSSLLSSIELIMFFYGSIPQLLISVGTEAFVGNSQHVPYVFLCVEIIVGVAVSNLHCHQLRPIIKQIEVVGVHLLRVLDIYGYDDVAEHGINIMSGEVITDQAKLLV